MMYLKQFPDICREMGFDVEEKEKIVTLCVTDINCNDDTFFDDWAMTVENDPALSGPVSYMVHVIEE